MSGPRDVATVRRLFREYERSLSTDLCFQGFEGEVQSLPGAYVPPGGALLLGRVDGAVAGCVGLRAGPEPFGELKRLFVRPGYRRSGLGTALVEEIVRTARAVPYDGIVLDTLAEMTAAHRLYVRLGFREVEPYGSTSEPGMRYFRREFGPVRSSKQPRVAGQRL
ncbi:MAG: GNAT family N-acetyltransferase [Thermoplasmata archaeon]|nr:GNAT family N-acetyltransferase [Thermoplasmata archaeon]MCI4361672.1 GNAT family N-acetyltransferase [Thermoplasmata archaeon]